MEIQVICDDREVSNLDVRHLIDWYTKHYWSLQDFLRDEIQEPLSSKYSIDKENRIEKEISKIKSVITALHEFESKKSKQITKDSR